MRVKKCALSVLKKSIGKVFGEGGEQQGSALEEAEGEKDA